MNLVKSFGAVLGSLADFLDPFSRLHVFDQQYIQRIRFPSQGPSNPGRILLASLSSHRDRYVVNPLAAPLLRSLSEIITATLCRPASRSTLPAGQGFWGILLMHQILSTLLRSTPIQTAVRLTAAFSQPITYIRDIHSIGHRQDIFSHFLRVKLSDS